MRGVALLHYGTPSDAADVAAYYTHIRRGRPPTEEQLADLRRRYDAIGGVSPLTARTDAQATGLSAELGDGWVVATGAKHTAPFIEQAIARLAGVEVSEAVALVLAPHYSSLSIGEYAERAHKAGNEHRLTIHMVESWHLEDGLVDLVAERLTEVVPADLVLFTAHSLPARIMDNGDPYPDQVRETAAAVVARMAAPVTWRTAWQSAGRTPEPWLGPDLLDVIREAAADGVRSIAVCPVGFVSDHLEVLYDIDVEARRVAADAGIELRRTRSLNDDERFVAVLADVVRRALP